MTVIFRLCHLLSFVENPSRYGSRKRFTTILIIVAAMVKDRTATRGSFETANFSALLKPEKLINKTGINLSEKIDSDKV